MSYHQRTRSKRKKCFHTHRGFRIETTQKWAHNTKKAVEPAKNGGEKKLL